MDEELIWTIDNENDGYPYPIDVDPTEFIFFEKDTSNYPKNLGVWKQDNQNDGYPWITGFIPNRMRLYPHRTYIVSNQANLKQTRCYIVDNQQLHTLQVNVKQ